jgi:peroxiredoxin
LFSAIGRYSRFEGKFENKDDKDLAAIRKLLRQVEKDFADIRLDGQTFAELAEGLLFELDHLIPGEAAPEIEGINANGKKMKLSDQRGKVVVLVFWGSWCGPCMAEVPYLRKLMAGFGRGPFTVVSVNSGDSKDKAAKAIADHKMTWPVFFDGMDGPIVKRWNVIHFPTIYLIDSKGIIRVKQLSDYEIFERNIENLVAEAKVNRETE